MAEKEDKDANISDKDCSNKNFRKDPYSGSMKWHLIPAVVILFLLLFWLCFPNEAEINLRNLHLKGKAALAMLCLSLIWTVASFVSWKNYSKRLKEKSDKGSGGQC